MVGAVDDLGPDDRSSFDRDRDRLVNAFVKSEGARYAHVVEQVLDVKQDYLDGDPTRWSVDDVEGILFEIYPAKVMLDAAAIAEVAPGFAAFLRFVGRDLPAHEPPLDALAQFVERSASRFVAAMNDEDNWSFGKRMWSTAVAEGVDLSDERELQRWMTGFNQRSLAERDQILGPMPSVPARLGGALIGALPPVVLAPDAELAALAAGTVLVRRLVTLAGYIGAGRSVTDRQNLKLADGKELARLLYTGDRVDEWIGDRLFKTKSSEELRDVDYTYRVALAAGLLEIAGRKVVPGPNAAWAPDASLDLAYGAFLVMLQVVGPTGHRWRKDHYGFGWYAEELDRQLPAMLIELYRHRQPTDIDELLDEAWAGLHEAFDLSDVPADKLRFHRGGVDVSLRDAFDRLAELGVVAIADEVGVHDDYGGVKRSSGTVELAPLGLWAVQRMASRVTSAPVVGTLRTVSASELLRAASDLPEDVARVELEAWADHHGDQAAAELCAALRSADETGRGLAFRALLRLGEDAAEAVATLADDAELADFVTVFRVDTLRADAAEMDRSGDPAGWVRLLHTVIQLWGPAAAASVWAASASGDRGIEAMLDTVWRVKGEPTEVVLSAVGGHHPDKTIAKAARKALFKHRSAG